MNKCVSLLKLLFFLQFLWGQIVKVRGEFEIRGVLRRSEDLRLTIQLCSDWLSLLKTLQMNLHVLQGLWFLWRQHQVLLSLIWELFMNGEACQKQT